MFKELLTSQVSRTFIHSRTFLFIFLKTFSSLLLLLLLLLQFIETTVVPLNSTAVHTDK